MQKMSKKCKKVLTLFIQFDILQMHLQKRAKKLLKKSAKNVKKLLTKPRKNVILILRDAKRQRRNDL